MSLYLCFAANIFNIKKLEYLHFVLLLVQELCEWIMLVY